MWLLTTWCSLAGESKSRKKDRIEHLGGTWKGSVSLVKALVILQGNLTFLTTSIDTCDTTLTLVGRHCIDAVFAVLDSLGGYKLIKR